MRYRDYSSFDEVNAQIQLTPQSGGVAENVTPAWKGVYVYHAIEGGKPGVDFPVGFDGETSMGDYFKFLSPTVFADINDFPVDLRRNIAKSSSMDFLELDVVHSGELNMVFDCVWN